MLAATWLVLVFLVSGGAGARGASAGFGLGVTWWTYLLKQAEALVLYLRLSLWPHPLVLDYGTAVVRNVSDVAGQGAFVLALLAATVWALWRRPLLGFVGAWFFLILAPSSSVVPLVTQTMAEHRMYLPLAALGALFAVLVYRWLGGRSSWLLAVCAVGCGAATVLRNHTYRDAVAIWADTVAHCPANPRAHNNLALALVHAGRASEAHDAYARAVALDPGYVSARYNWGVALLAAGRIAEAATQFEAAVRLAPSHADATLNLGNVLVRLGRPAEAIPQFERALALRPAADAHYNLAVALADAARPAEAGPHLEAALRLDANLPEAHYQLGRLAEQAGRWADAERDYGRVIGLVPEHLAAHRRLGLLLARDERLAPAAEHFRTVIRLVPADADAHANLGNVLLLAGQPREAIAQYEQALRLRPADPRTRENLRLAREALR
ncbi:MAG: tetratricopeptide repeat protein [Verrucomicrobia bacterium]|nr:tetratricopeptide repeat protein [Verrucomicrobiota bacterium]